jgi:hypothetical protein
MPVEVSGMLPAPLVIAGLDGLARSYAPPATTDAGFGNGHRSAALLAGLYLIEEGLAEPQAAAPIRTLVEHLSRIPACAPLEPEPSAPHELDRLLTALARSLGTSESHGAIFPTFALRVFRERPDLITRTRVEGLLRMAEAYAPTEPPPTPPADPPFVAGRWADEALEAFVGSAQAYRGRFQGYTGHVLTYAQAVLDLHDLGYRDLARLAEMGCRQHVAKCLLGPTGPYSQLAFPVTEPTPQLIRPDLSPFWLAHPSAPNFAQGLGHVIKYAYAFTCLCRRATDPGSIARARELYFLVAWG